MRKNVFTKIMVCCGAFAVLTGLVWAGDKLSREAEARFASAEISSRPQRIQVALDAGHGGMDGGCVSVDGTPEKGINLDIALTERHHLYTPARAGAVGARLDGLLDALHG